MEINSVPSICLRDYQQEAINCIESFWEFGFRKILLFAPTGSGKGVILSYVMQKASDEGKRAIFVVRGRELVKQGSKRLSCPHGIFMNGHKSNGENIQVCSIDTMNSRGHYPEAEIVVIDEAHLCGNDSYRTMAAAYPDARFMAVTATPWQKESIEHIAEEVVQTCSIETLIEQGFLVGPRYFAPFKPDLSGIKIMGGDYSQKDLQKFMENSAIVGGIIENYEEHVKPRPDSKTLCFTSGVKQSKLLVDKFNLAGIPACHMDANTTDDDRKEILSQLESGDIRVVSNVGILTTGVDMPWITDIIDAAPTLSECKYVQKLGRGTRKIPGKDFFFVWDHAGNVHRHGWIQDERPAQIKGKPKKPPGDAPVKTCPQCFAVLPSNASECDNCGYSFSDAMERERRIREEEGKLLEIKRELDKKLTLARKTKNKFAKIAYRKLYKRGWVWYRILETLSQEFGSEEGEEYAKKVWKHSRASEIVPSDFA
jgi:superfamily II DNA or RNA helicase